MKRHIEYAVVVLTLGTVVFAVSGAISAGGAEQTAMTVDPAIDKHTQRTLIVGLIVAAAERLQQEGIAVRCVSIPSWDLFDALPQAEREAVLPPSVRARLAVEAGATQGWHRYVGDAGVVIGVDRFGASGPGKTVLREYGLTVDNVYARAKALLA